MKTTIYIFQVLLAFSSCDLEYPRACATFACSNEQETAEGTCGTRNNTLVTWGKCPTGEFCVEDPYENTKYLCKYGNLAPGTLVSDNKMCESSKLVITNTSSSCAGIAAGGVCRSDIDCGVNLYCSNKICTPVIADWGACTSTAQCSSRAYCVNKICVLIGSLPVGAPNTEFELPACSTNWVDFTTKKCAQGWTLGSNVTQPKEGDLCNIMYQGKAVINYVNWQAYRYARCEYREDGQAVCQKGPGDYHAQFIAVYIYIYIYIMYYLRYQNIFKSINQIVMFHTETSGDCAI